MTNGTVERHKCVFVWVCPPCRRCLMMVSNHQLPHARTHTYSDTAFRMTNVKNSGPHKHHERERELESNRERGGDKVMGG